MKKRSLVPAAVRAASLASVFALAAVPAFAADPAAPVMALNVQAAYYVPNLGGYGADGFAPPEYRVVEGNDAPGALRSLGSTWGAAEAKAALSVSSRVPFMVGEGPLFSGNSIRAKFSCELSPVSVNGVAQASFVPIAFLSFDAGAGIGTGWTAGPFRGLGINPAGNAASDVDLKPFGGAVWRAWGSGTFQFDVAALAPGDWNHLVVLATAKAEHEAFTGAGADEAWLWEADAADNFNGTKFYSSFVLAYLMPLKLDTIGLVLDSEEWLGDVRGRSTMASGGWGSDFRIWQLGSLMNFKLSKKDSLAVLCQFKLKPDWSEATTRNRDFRTRAYEDAYWCFHRVALSYTHTF